MVGINDIAKSQAALANRALARLLHADVQNELLARSVALRALPNETGDSESLQRIIDEHRAAVVTYLTQLAEEQRSFPSNETLDDFMVGQAASWNGVATILFSGCDDLTLDSDVARALKDVGAEAIANAVKHGMATRVEVSLRAEPEGLVITVDDDGLGPRGGAHGLGAFLYTSVSHSAWRLTESPTLRGARLTLRVKREG
jgi:signal transduction histidine kinase